MSPVINDEVIVVTASEDEGGETVLICPYCRAENAIVEQDSAIRWNRLTEVTVENGTVFFHWSTHGDHDFEGDFFFCEACQKHVSMPDNAQHDYD